MGQARQGLLWNTKPTQHAIVAIQVYTQYSDNNQGRYIAPNTARQWRDILDTIIESGLTKIALNYCPRQERVPKAHTFPLSCLPWRLLLSCPQRSCLQPDGRGSEQIQGKEFAWAHACRACMLSCPPSAALVTFAFDRQRCCGMTCAEHHAAASQYCIACSADYHTFSSPFEAGT